ncbi:MAG: ABC transporter substrate-binding protein, partial [Haloarcula sp.]
MGNRRSSGGKTSSRRTLLRTIGASGLVGLAGCGGSEGETADTGTPTPTPIGNYPVSGDSVTFGFGVAQSGPYSMSGQQELRGLTLAVKHINNGGGWIGDDSFDSPLSGDGLLGKKVEYAVKDTESSPSTARKKVQKLINSDDVIMLAGGTASGTGIAQQELAAQEQVVYMATMSHHGSLTGSACNRFSFREIFNSRMTARALAPVLVEQFGEDVEYAQFFSENDWGKSLRDDMDSVLREGGWAPIWGRSAQVGTSDFSQYAAELEQVDPDVIVLSLRGLDAANALREFREAYPETDIVLPLSSVEVAQSAGAAIEGVIGTIAWSPALNSPQSDAFRESFRNEYGSSTGSSKSADPSGPAHVAYTQVLQYASAVERAGTFNPTAVIAELEDHEYNVGLGPQTLRACDHQAMRRVPVVRGRPETQQAYGEYYSLLGEPRDVRYACDTGPAADCSLGDN